MTQPIDSSTPLSIWSNHGFTPAGLEQLTKGIGRHQLLRPAKSQSSNLAAAGRDPQALTCDVAFGQPDPLDILESKTLKWVHLTSAGYTRYERKDLRDALPARPLPLTTSSTVFAEPCAQHLLAMIMGLARDLPTALAREREHMWDSKCLRATPYLIQNQTILLVGYGSIAARLAAMLAPMNPTMIGFRRTPRGDESIKTLPLSELDAHLPTADQVVNILPAAEGTNGFFSAERMSKFKRGTRFYNIGRGSTVDQTALVEALTTNHISNAYLDVTDPEPLPKGHPLWIAPDCHITPHTAGGFRGEEQVLIEHFLTNLRRFEGKSDLLDRVI